MKSFEEIAHEYVEEQGEILDGFKYTFSNRTDFVQKIYFDFTIIKTDESISKEPPTVGGACGFTIDKRTLEIETLSFGELAQLSIRQKELDEAYGKLQDLKTNSSSLTWFKKKYNLTSPELLQVKKLLSATEVTKDHLLTRFIEIVEKNR